MTGGAGVILYDITVHIQCLSDYAPERINMLFIIDRDTTAAAPVGLTGRSGWDSRGQFVV